jgi:hypothetical protein
MPCISRITDEKFAQRFGDGKHNFHLELRCNLPCLPGLEICSKCTEKSPTYKTHGSRKFDHGKINEPIPDNSHIFGGKWYNDRLASYGSPPPEIIQFALQYQQEARQGYTVIQPNYDTTTSKDKQQSTIQENTMPRPKKDPSAPAKKRGKPPIGNIQIIDDTPSETSTQTPIQTPAIEENVAPKKRAPAKRKTPNPDNENTVTTTAPKKRAPAKKKPVIGNINNVLINPDAVNIIDAIIPTYIENSIDILDTYDYEVVYVKLTPFELNGKSYLRDTNKNKLFQVIKGKPGKYIGRFYPETDEIDTDIPDSDDETEENDE